MTNSTKAPTSYWVITIIMLLWNLMGVMSFFVHVFMQPAETEAQAALYDQYPLWTQLVFAVSVFGGTIGCVGLLMRKRFAKQAFLASLIAIIIQFTHSLGFTDSIEVYGNEPREKYDFKLLKQVDGFFDEQLMAFTFWMVWSVR